MKKRTKRWLKIISFAAIVGFILLNILACNHTRAMMRFAPAGTRTPKPEELSFFSKLKVLLVGVSLPRPTTTRTSSDLAPESQILTISGTNGITLEAWYSDQGPDTPLVLLFHAYTAEKASLLVVAKSFLDLGASVLLVDFRGSGGSSESYSTIGFHEADDVAAAVHYADTNLSHNKTILFGSSMGAVAVLRAVHNNGLKPDAVIVEGVFDTMLNTVRNRFRAMQVPSFPSAQMLVFWGGQQHGFNGFKHNPVDYAASLQCPALFMHGSDDQRATIKEGRRVYDAAPGFKTFKAFDQAGHQSFASSHAEEWKTTVDAFLNEAEHLSE